MLLRVLPFIPYCNLTNEMQDMIEGEIGSLPHFAQWSVLELQSQECALVSGDDQ